MRPEIRYLCALLALAGVGALAVLYTTLHGPGLSSDSVAYLRGARLLAEGGGLADLAGHFPPGYSMLWAQIVFEYAI